MTMTTHDELRKALHRMEPETIGDTDADHVQCSIAISLKRIADAIIAAGESDLSPPSEVGDGDYAALGRACVNNGLAGWKDGEAWFRPPAALQHRTVTASPVMVLHP